MSQASAGQLPFTGWREKDDRTIRRVRELLAEDQLDALLPSKPAHVAYLTNYFDAVHAVISWEEMASFLLIPLEQDAFIAGSHEHAAGRSDYGVHPWWLKDEHRSGEWWGCDTNIEVFADQVRKRGLNRGRIGYERKWMPMPIFDKLRAALPDVRWTPADRIVPQVRLVKTAREQQLMRQAVAGGMGAMEAFMNALRGGASHPEAQLARAKRALELGVEWVGGAMRMGWTGGTFETLGWWDAPARQRYLRCRTGRNWQSLPDDAPVHVTHFETRCDYYFSDIAWHEFLGALPALDERVAWPSHHGEDARFTGRELLQDFQFIRRIQHEAINQIRIGMNQSQARAAVEACLARDDEYRQRGAGYFIHSLGLEVHEEPVLAAANPNALPEDVPIVFEPGAVCSSEWFSRLWTVEDPFVLRENGKWEPLTPLRGLTADTRPVAAM